MKRVMAIVVACMVLSVVAPASSNAQQPAPIFITPQASAVATEILNGTVQSKRFVETSDGVHTVVEVEVSSTLRGASSHTVVVEVPGGVTSSGVEAFVSHVPHFEIGDALQFALVETPTAEAAQIDPVAGQVRSVVGGTQGVARLDGGAVTSQLEDFQAGQGYTLNGKKWPGFPVGYRVRPGNSGLTPAVTIAAVNRGFQLWEALPTSNIDFTYEGTTSAGPTTTFDGANVVGWITTPNPADTYLAQTTLWSRGDGMTIGFDIRFNRDDRFVDGTNRDNHFDVQTVTLHEAGHALGLSHIADPQQVMYPVILEQQRKPLGAGDKAGVRLLYPDNSTPPPAAPKCEGLTATHVVPAGGQPFFGTAGADVIVGSLGNDVIHALGGNDVVCGRSGRDRVYAGPGNDRVFGMYGNDRLFGGPGNDRVFGGGGFDAVFGGDGTDTIFGGNGNDEVRGGNGADRCYGGTGTDRHFGCETRGGFP